MRTFGDTDFRKQDADFRSNRDFDMRNPPPMNQFGRGGSMRSGPGGHMGSGGPGRPLGSVGMDRSMGLDGPMGRDDPIGRDFLAGRDGPMG